jgi:AcrR family transcriptional regulator
LYVCIITFVAAAGERTADRRRRQGEKTRRALLRAARAPFAREGYAKASVRRIARAAGAHPALLTYHFGTKRKLYREVLRDALGALGERILSEAAAAETPAAAAERALSAYLDHLAADPAFPQLVLRAVLDGEREVTDVLERMLSPLVAAGQELEVARASGDAREALVSFFGAAVAPYLYAPLLERLTGEDPTSPAATTRRRRHLSRLVSLYLDAGRKGTT